MNKNNFSTLILTVQNRPGVLYRISGLIRKRRFNISSLTVSATADADISRFTIVVEGDKETVEKMAKQLNKVIEIIKVIETKDEDIVARELALFKVQTTKVKSKSEITQLADDFGATVIEIHSDYIMLEITGNEDKINKFYESMKKFGVMEFVRTGRTALFK